MQKIGHDQDGNTNGRSFVIPTSHENFHLETPSRDGETIHILGDEWLPNPLGLEI
jgi:hypothetical protein